MLFILTILVGCQKDLEPPEENTIKNDKEQEESVAEILD